MKSKVNMNLCSIALLALPIAAMATTQYWVVTPCTTPAQIQVNAVGELVMGNGLVERTFSPINGNVATSGWRNLYSGESMLSESSQVEAIIGLDGSNYSVGGNGSAATTFRYTGYVIGNPVKPYEWSPKRGAVARPWPALGKALTLTYKADSGFAAKYRNLQVIVNYEIYQGIPVICKKVTVINNGTQEVKVTYMASEALTVQTSLKGRFYLESDYHGASGNPSNSANPFIDNVFRRNDNGRTIAWTDSAGASLVKSRYDLGPDRRIAAGQSFTGFRTFELLHSVDAPEWQEMEIKQMYRVVAPQITENPIFLHLISDDMAKVRAMVDSCASVGFEMIIQSFSSGVNTLSSDAGYLSSHKSVYDYAHSKGIDMGAYTMLMVGDGGADGTNSGTPWDPVRCMASAWMDRYWGSTTNFIEKTGLDMMEVDGPYPMFTCSATNHAHHDGLNDSRERQWTYSSVQMNTYFRNRNMYSNQPDWLYLNGASKNSIGYWESTWSLPRQQQLMAGRLFNYDGTYQKTPAMGWTFVPIDVYQGGGSAASFEPLAQNLKDYEWALAQNFLYGIVAFYRGGRLYDNATTKAAVKKWVDFYKQYREILNSDIVHIRRPMADAANHARAVGIDAMMHANAQLKTKGLLGVWNQTDAQKTDTLVVPMFYTGLTDLESPASPVSTATPQTSVWPPWPPSDPFPTWAFTADQTFPTAGTPTARRALVSQEDRDSVFHTIDSKGNMRIPVTLAPMSYTWYSIQADPNVTAIKPFSSMPGGHAVSIQGNRIGFNLTSTEKVTIAIYTPQGRKVRTLANGYYGPAAYNILWDGKDDRSLKVSQDHYLCRITLGNERIAWQITPVE